jgi:type IV secretory pathway VirB4 component
MQINKNQSISTQIFLETKEVRDDIIILKDGSFRSVIMVSSLNFDLKSDDERSAILSQFQDMVNAVDFPIQILMSSRRLVIDEYLKDIKEKEEKQTNELLKMQTAEYAEFIKSFIDLHTVMSKTFYIVVPYSKSFELKPAGGFSGFFKKKSTEISESESEEFARSKVQLFQRVNNIIGSLSNLGLSAAHLNTDELKELLFRAYNPGEEKREIDFSKVTDINSLIAPSGIMVESDYLKIAKKYSKTFYTFSYPRYLTDAWLENVINLDLIFDTSLFIHPSDTATLVKSLRGRVAEVQSQISANEEKGIVRDPVLETAYRDLEELRDKLQQGTEKFFRVGLYITIYSETLEALKKDESVLTSLFDARLISLKEATFLQEDGFNSTLPLCLDRLLVHTPMNTEPIASFFPFVSTDLSSGHGVLYGINRHNNSLIIFDRFSLQNGNMILFATSGAGKSYAAKLEVLREMMMGTDVIIIDPEAEYQYLAETVGGTFVKISLTSVHHINPFELPPALKDESNEDILKEAIINLEGLLRLLIGKLSPEEDAILEKALIETYASKDITAESDFSKIEPPIFTDFYRILSEMRGGAPIAQRLEKYVSGVFSGFLNFPTNVDMENQLVIFNIRDLQADLRPVAMYVILNYIWTKVRSKLKKRILLVDEAWIMMQNEDSAAFLFGIAKRCRKYYLGLTTITQDVADFMQSKYGRPIITNSSIQILLKQSPAIVNTVQETFNLTGQEKNLLLQSGIGEGIFFAGLKRAAIRIIASYTEDQIITSDPKQLLEIEEAKKELAG